MERSICWFGARSTRSESQGPGHLPRSPRQDDVFSVASGFTQLVDAVALQRRTRSAQMVLRAEYDRVFALLIRRGLLDATEARDLTAAIHVRVTDLRRLRSSPLPVLPPLRR
jgi:hypothetical protein